MRPLAKGGFFTTPEAQVIRWREFTPLFWRTLNRRKEERIKRMLDAMYNLGVIDGVQTQLNRMRRELGMEEMPLPSHHRVGDEHR
jgi:hypothetical protein